MDVRVIAATNRNLPEMVSAGQFREDLLYRLRVIHLHVPPLRDRKDEIRPLAAAFIKRFGRDGLQLTRSWKALDDYRWPGNVRELQNVIEQLVSMAQPGVPVPLAQVPHVRQRRRLRCCPPRERRRQVADDLYQALVSGDYSFWEHIHPLFLSRDITRHDIRQLVRRGLSTTRGNYRGLLELFRMPPEDYKRFMNFLATHDSRPISASSGVRALKSLTRPASCGRRCRHSSVRMQNLANWTSRRPHPDESRRLDPD